MGGTLDEVLLECTLTEMVMAEGQAQSAGRTPMIHRLGELTKKGHPWHPRSRSYDTELQEWNVGNAPPQVP